MSPITVDIPGDALQALWLDSEAASPALRMAPK
jgi:hypothetical protein